MPKDAKQKANHAARSSDASSATSPEKSSHCSPTPHQATHTSDPGQLRHRRQAAGLSLAHAAHQLNTWPATVSMIERGKLPHHHLVPAYRDWLNTLQPAA